MIPTTLLALLLAASRTASPCVSTVVVRPLPAYAAAGARARRASRWPPPLPRCGVRQQPPLRDSDRGSRDLQRRLPAVPARHAILVLQLRLESDRRRRGGRVGRELPRLHGAARDPAAAS